MGKILVTTVSHQALDMWWPFSVKYYDVKNDVKVACESLVGRFKYNSDITFTYYISNTRGMWFAYYSVHVTILLLWILFKNDVNN